MNRFSVIKKIIIILALVSFRVYSLAQENNWDPSYMNISVNEGLPSSECYYVYQDRKGYMWFCTDQGVVRYDGFRLKLFNKSNGLPDEVVFKIFEDESGRLWFYLYSGKLAYYDPQKRSVFPYEYNHLLNKLNHGDFNILKSFTVDKNDNVYYTGMYKCARIDKNGKLFVYNQKKGEASLLQIENSWLTLINFNFSGENKRLRIVPKNSPPFYYTHDAFILKRSILDINNTLFLGVNNYILNLRKPSEKIEFIGQTGMYNVGGELWVTTLSGVYRFKDPENADFTKPDGVYLKDQKITSVAKDSEGGYWFSTLDNGVYYAASIDVVNWLPEEKEKKGTIHDINGIGNDIYYSSAFGYYNLRTGEQLLAKRGPKNVIGVWNNKLVLSSNIPFYVSRAITKSKWGIQTAQFQGWTIDEKDDFYAIYAMPFMIHKRTEGYEELLKWSQIYNPKKYTAHTFQSLAFDENGELYAGSQTGLFRVRKKGIEKCKLRDDMNGVRITALKYHKKWGLIAATRGKGIVFLKNEKVIGGIEREDGLLSNQLNAIYVDKNGILYAATNKGVSKIVQGENQRIQIFNLTELNGLSSAEVSVIFSTNDSVYVGTREGITLIPPSYKWDRPTAEKQIRIQAVFANGKRVVNFKNGTEFNASQRIIRFLLETTNYKAQHKQPYKYRFRKKDPWSIGFSGELIMINPACEAYELEIQYLNESGVWSKPYILTQFSILPPFYSTWWFTTLIALVLLLISFLIFRNRLKEIQRRNKIQRNMELLEQKALLAQMNPHFIFNALNSIQSFLLYNENELAERYLLKLSKLIRLTLTNSRETEITIQKEIDSLQMYLELEQMRFKDRFEFHFEISLSKEDLNKSIPPMLIQPFVENAVIHGFKGLEQGGKINLYFKWISHNRLVVEVTDNGVGYVNSRSNTQNSEHKSYATQITSERLSLFKEKYNTEFDFVIENSRDEDGDQRGTKVTILIPVFDKEWNFK